MTHCPISQAPIPPGCIHYPRPGVCRVGRSDLQSRLVAWHQERFPWAESHHVALKAMEELGEVASALLATGPSAATGRGGNVAGEAADVVISLMVLLGRWHSGTDLLDEVERKLAILTDRTSGHRSALQP